MTSPALLSCGRPTSVHVYSESVRLERSKPPPEESAVFDGRLVRLRGGRGETLGLEVRSSGNGAFEASLELPESTAHVDAFSVRSLRVTDPSSSMYGESAGPGVYPDVLVPAQGRVVSNDLAYFDVAIAKSARPGRYQGELDVENQRFAVVLDVTRARIDLSERPLVWVFYSPSEIARTAGLSDGDSPDLVEKEAEYDALFRAHGAYLASDLPPARFEARRNRVHDVTYWPVAIDTANDESTRTDVRRWLDLFRDVRATPFAIPVDEPRSTEQRRRAAHVAEVIGEAGGGRPRLLRAVTDAASPVYRGTMDVYISPRNFPVREGSAEPGVRFWTYNGRPPAAGSMTVDTEGAALRTWGWIAERYGIDLWYAWEGLYFSDRYNKGGPTDVMHDPVTFDERRIGGDDWGNGDGVLAYPGSLPSLRLKILRRGLEDRLLLRELEACGGEEQARDIVRRTVPRALGEAGEEPSWPTAETDWERARGEVLDAIEARCHDDA